MVGAKDAGRCKECDARGGTAVAATASEIKLKPSSAPPPSLLPFAHLAGYNCSPMSSWYKNQEAVYGPGGANHSRSMFHKQHSPLFSSLPAHSLP